jgi:biopolymer transport protein ExbD
MKVPTGEADEALAGIDLTPLIDAVFQLLIFAMITATFQSDERDLAINVPEAEHGNPVKDLPETLIVGVRKDGSFTVGAQILDKEELRQLLVRAKRKNPKQKVVVRAHREAATQHPVTVIDVCTGLSIETSIATTEATAN